MPPVHYLPSHCLEDYFTIATTPERIRTKKPEPRKTDKSKVKAKKKVLSTTPLRVKVRRIPVQGGDRIGWEYHSVVLSRVPGYGFGIAVSGGRDNPHFMHGDPSIAISDVLKGGPAEGRLQVNDRVVTANGISLENVEYASAVQVLRDCGEAVNLLVKRRVLLPTASDLLKVTLSKNRKKDDFGIVLGCRLYIKEITNRSLIEKDSSLQEGDVILKINNLSADGINLKEAKKLMDAGKEKLHLVIRREQNTLNSRLIENNQRNNGCNLYENGTGFSPFAKESAHVNAMNRQNWTVQNVYVQPPTRGGPGHGQQLPTPPRNRGPLNDISLAQLDQPATPLLDDKAPPRPPTPRLPVYGATGEAGAPVVHQSPEPRKIAFRKDGQVGIRLTGGNEVGIFVTAVQPGCPAFLQGLMPGDKILRVNNVEFQGMTREEAVLFLLSVQDQVEMIVSFRRDEYEDVVSNHRGDNLYIRTHFTYQSTNKGELGFNSGEIFRVVDTLYGGVVGSWKVHRLNRSNQEVQKGLIPNKSRAEALAAEEQAEKAKKAENGECTSRHSFFKRRSARRTKSLTKDHWEDVVFGEGSSKFPPYERVSLKHPGFIRPVVIFGALADVARDKLMKDYPDKYSTPQTESPADDAIKGTAPKTGIVRLSSIKEIVEKGKHALLDITPSAVNRLNYAQFYPLVIFLRADSKSVVKELRSRYPKTVQKSSRKLFDQAVKLEKLWSHVFTSNIALTSADLWYKKLREAIEKQQGQNIWVAESKPEENITDDFLFPMNSSRLSYASSPESDLDLTLNSKDDDRDDDSPRLKKASSDPSIVTNEELQGATSSAFSPYPGRNRQLPLHLVLRKEISKALKRDSKAEPKASMAASMDDEADREEYFGRDSSAVNDNREIYGVATVRPAPLVHRPVASRPEPPPRIDRAMKPTRFRSAHERLFGRADSSPSADYINTSAPDQLVDSNSLERSVIPPNQTNGWRAGGVGAYDTISSFSAESNPSKYGSPNATLEARYRMNGQPPAGGEQSGRHDPYRFTRSTGMSMASTFAAPPQDRNSRALPPKTFFDSTSANKAAPPSPPSKPMLDGRPVPPPKPVQYQSLGAAYGWRSGPESILSPESTYGHVTTATLGYTSPPSLPSTPRKMDSFSGTSYRDLPPNSPAPPPPVPVYGYH
ncbi:Tight junction protein ZO-1 [Halotydeus destructor]|nr:Tight junction protein ZO-1 [Halotydeus destructor]